MSSQVMLKFLASCVNPANLKWVRPAAFSTASVRYSDNIDVALKTKEAPQKDSKSALMTQDEIAHQTQLEGHITITQPMNISAISGVPEEHIKNRLVRIYQPSKNAMQSGTNSIGHWQIDFDTRERWENPLMGWTSSGDPLSNMKVEFTSQDDAVEFCNKNGWKWFVQLDKPKKTTLRPYAQNYSWNKRTRTSTK